MKRSISVLHIAAHLGGGIGKVLSGLIKNTSESRIQHSVICLEYPEKTQFIEKLNASDCPVTVAPDQATLARLIAATDIVQMEWWGHPVSIAAMCSAPLPAMRLMVWCHIAGVHTPIIPARLIESVHRCLFTSPCSYKAAEVAQLFHSHGSIMDVVHSSGGFDGFDLVEQQHNTPLVAGYLGSLNFSKLHPDFVEFLSAVTDPLFKVRMIGDTTNRDVLERQCVRAGRPDMLDFRGYTTNVAKELSAINVFPYLLNPKHYGTSENALLEAMAMGAVPIVLDNPAERHLVKDRKTGLIVRTPQEFADAINWLSSNPEERLKIVRQATSSVRKEFSADNMAEAFNHLYSSVCKEDKKRVSFVDIFGRTPAEWFLASQRNPEFFTDNKLPEVIDELILPGLLEKTKGSVFHYHNHFPEDLQLGRWAENLHSYQSKIGG